MPQPFGRGFDLERVVLPIQIGSDLEARSCGGFADELEGLVVAGERLSGPVLADLTEQAALNRVVLGGAGGIVGNGDGKSELIAEALLDLVLPGATCGGIAAPGVGQDQQLLRVGVALTAFTLPPATDGMEAKAEVSWETPTNTEPRFARRS